MNRITLIVLFALLITSSCDPGVSHDKIIENHSDYNLEVTIYPTDYGTDIENEFYDSLHFLIPMHTESVIGEAGGLGQNSNYKGCRTQADSIIARVFGNDSLTVNINLADSNNWSFKILETTYKDGGVNECRIVITNADIE